MNIRTIVTLLNKNLMNLLIRPNILLKKIQTDLIQTDLNTIAQGKQTE